MLLLPASFQFNINAGDLYFISVFKKSVFKPFPSRSIKALLFKNFNYRSGLPTVYISVDKVT